MESPRARRRGALRLGAASFRSRARGVPPGHSAAGGAHRQRWHAQPPRRNQPVLVSGVGAVDGPPESSSSWSPQAIPSALWATIWTLYCLAVSPTRGAVAAEIASRIPVLLTESPVALARTTSWLRAYRRGADNLHLGPHSIDLQDIPFPAKAQKKPNRVIAIGRWTSFQKNFPSALRVAMDFLKERPDYEFHFVGETPETRPVADRLLFHGRIAHAGLGRLLAGSNILFASSRYESFHLAAGEALCSGCSVVLPSCIPTAEWFASEKSGTISTAPAAQRCSRPSGGGQRLGRRAPRCACDCRLLESPPGPRDASPADSAVTELAPSRRERGAAPPRQRVRTTREPGHRPVAHRCGRPGSRTRTDHRQHRLAPGRYGGVPDDHTGPAFLQQPGKRPCAGGNHRHAAEHRFRHSQSKSLRAGGMDEAMHLAGQNRHDLIVRAWTKEGDPAIQAQVRRPAMRRPILAEILAHQNEPRAGSSLHRFAEGPESQIKPLQRPPMSHRHEDGPAAKRLRVRGGGICGASGFGMTSTPPRFLPRNTFST